MKRLVLFGFCSFCLALAACASPEGGEDGDGDSDADVDSDADGDSDLGGDGDPDAEADADLVVDSGDDGDVDADIGSDSDLDGSSDADGDGGLLDAEVGGGVNSCLTATAGACIVLSRCDELPSHLQGPALACPTFVSDNEEGIGHICQGWLDADSSSELAAYINDTPPSEVDRCARTQGCDNDLAVQMVSALLGIPEGSRTDLLTLVEASTAGCY